MKDFRTINNIFESPSYREKQARVLKLFVFCQFLVQGFQIKVENSSVVSFCRCLCRGSLCRDIGRECHIAALLDIYSRCHNTQEKNTQKHTHHICREIFVEYFPFLSEYVGDVKFDTIWSCLATPLGKSSILYFAKKKNLSSL